MRKGFTFTLFVFFIIALLLTTVAFQPVSLFRDVEQSVEKVKADEAFYFLESIQSDLDRAAHIAGRRATASLIQQAINGSTVTDAPANMTTLLFNGTFNNTTTPLMADSSLQEWANGVEDLAQDTYQTRIRFANQTISYANLSLGVRYTADILLNDTASPAAFHPTPQKIVDISITQLEDPFISLQTNGQFGQTFTACNSSVHARKLDAGNQTNIEEWVAEKTWKMNNTSTAFDNIPKDRIAVTEKVCAYNQTQLSALEEFAAVVSEETLDLQNQCDGNVSLDAFTGGIQYEKILNDTYTVVSGKDVWRNNILNQVRSGCYFLTEDGPSVFDRIENSTTNTQFQGIGHFLDLESMQADLTYERSALDYVYFNPEPYGSLHKIQGVTDRESWFRLDDTHVTRWNISDLTYG